MPQANKTIKKIVAATIKEETLQKIAKEKRMRSRKWLSWMVWLLIAIASFVILWRNPETMLDINLVLKLFGIVTVIYILGNVTEKFVMVLAEKLADKIGSKIEGFIDEE